MGEYIPILSSRNIYHMKSHIPCQRLKTEHKFEVLITFLLERQV